MDNLLGWLDNATNSSELINQYHAHAIPLKFCVKPKNHKPLETAMLFNDEILPNNINSVYCDDEHQAIVIGTPRWLDLKLRKLSKERNHAFALIEAYETSGPQCLENIRGHFALFVLNTKKKSAFVAVDRMGTRSVNFSQTSNGGLLFGSSAEIIRHHPNIQTSVDLQSIYNYVYFHVIPSPDTIYKNIKKLEPAHYLVYEGGKLKIVHYWKPEFIEQLNGSVEENCSELRQLVKNAILLREPSSSMGAFLSGGLDSSTVSGTLAKFLPHAKTYSIGFAEEGYDEMEYAKIASSHFKTELINYYVTADDVIEAIPTMAGAYDEPFGNSSAIPALFCARLAFSNGTRELFAGDGGDEIFAGNERYAKQKLFSVHDRFPAWFQNGVLKPLFVSFPPSKITPGIKKLRSYIMQARMPMPDRMESYNFLQRTAIDTIFDPGFLQNIDSDGPLKLLRNVYWRSDENADLLNRMLYLDWKFTLADNDVRKVNRMCEITNIAVHYPFLDDEIIEFSTHIPSEIKLKGQSLRSFYKEAYKNFLPQEILSKPKHGFGLPFGIWLKKSEKLQDIVYANLSSLKQRQIVQPAFIDELVKSHQGGHEYYYGTMVWVLAMLEQWFQQHQVAP